MHHYPQNFLLRTSLALMTSVVVIYMAYDLLHQQKMSPEPPAVLSKQIHKLPETKIILQKIRQINSILHSPLKTAQNDTLDADLFPSKDSDAVSLVQIKPTLIMTSKNNNVAVINNSIYKQGDSLPDGRKIALISAEGLFLHSGKNKQYIVWKNPKHVLLVQGPSPETKKNHTPSQTLEADNGADDTDTEATMTSQELGALFKKIQTEGTESD